MCRSTICILQGDEVSRSPVQCRAFHLAPFAGFEALAKETPLKDKQVFMDMYVNRFVGVMRELIDFYANATFLPRQIAAEYDALWTHDRMQSVIHAAIEPTIATGSRVHPLSSWRKAAKAKFSFGTNNTDTNLGGLEYPIQMVKECVLVWQDIFVPKPTGQKRIEVRK